MAVAMLSATWKPTSHPVGSMIFNLKNGISINCLIKSNLTYMFSSNRINKKIQ